MTELEVKKLIANEGAEGIQSILQYLTDTGIITTKQKLAITDDKSRGCIDNRMRRNYYRSVKIYKNATLLINHERITDYTGSAESTEKSA